MTTTLRALAVGATAMLLGAATARALATGLGPTAHAVVLTQDGSVVLLDSGGSS